MTSSTIEITQPFRDLQTDDIVTIHTKDKSYSVSVSLCPSHRYINLHIAGSFGFCLVPFPNPVGTCWLGRLVATGEKNIHELDLKECMLHLEQHVEKSIPYDPNFRAVCNNRKSQEAVVKIDLVKRVVLKDAQEEKKIGDVTFHA